MPALSIVPTAVNMPFAWSYFAVPPVIVSEPVDETRPPVLGASVALPAPYRAEREVLVEDDSHGARAVRAEHDRAMAEPRVHERSRVRVAATPGRADLGGEHGRVELEAVTAGGDGCGHHDRQGGERCRSQRKRAAPRSSAWLRARFGGRI
jgi:hypothetical protein